MKKQDYSEKQVLEAVQYWKSKLPAIMPDEEAGQHVDEADSIGKIGNALKAAKDMAAKGVKAVTSDARNALFKNPGVKSFVEIMAGNAKSKDPYGEDEMFFCVNVNGKFYSIVDVEFIDEKTFKLGRATIGLLADFTRPAKSDEGKTFTVADFRKKLVDAKQKCSKVSSTYSAFILGSADGGKPVSEAETAAAPGSDPAETPEGNVVYLGNPFRKVYQSKNWIVFSFDITDEEKQKKIDDMWG